MKQRLYAVVMCSDAPVSPTWVEFYWAEEPSHAIEQAYDTNPNSGRQLCVALVPYVEAREDVYRTESGGVLTDADIQALSDEALAEYDVSALQDVGRRDKEGRDDVPST